MESVFFFKTTFCCSGSNDNKKAITPIDKDKVANVKARWKLNLWVAYQANVGME